MSERDDHGRGLVLESELQSRWWRLTSDPTQQSSGRVTDIGRSVTHGYPGIKPNLRDLGTAEMPADLGICQS